MNKNDFAKYPPMGWNSWDCYGAAVTEKELRQNADYMAEHLKEQSVKICARPEELIVEPDGQEGLNAVVDDCVFLGLNTHYFVHLATGEKAEIIQESTIDSVIEPGTRVRLRLNTRKANLFSEDGEVNLLTGVHNDLTAMTSGKKGA